MTERTNHRMGWVCRFLIDLLSSWHQQPAVNPIVAWIRLFSNWMALDQVYLSSTGKWWTTLFMLQGQNDKSILITCFTLLIFLSTKKGKLYLLSIVENNIFSTPYYSILSTFSSPNQTMSKGKP